METSDRQVTEQPKPFPTNPKPPDPVLQPAEAAKGAGQEREGGMQERKELAGGRT